MNWKFWKKDSTPQQAGQPAADKLPGPKDIPESIGMHMVVALQKNPDWVWSLKAVMVEKPGEKDIRDIRIYDPAATASAKVSVKNYRTFDSRPELVLFEGWFNKKTRKFEIAEKSAGSRAKAA